MSSETKTKKFKLLNIVSIVFGSGLLIGWALYKILSPIISLGGLLWPFLVIAIAIGITFAVLRWFKEQAEIFFGIDLVKKISQSILLGILGYATMFYVSYGLIMPKIVKSLGLVSPYEALFVMTLLQLPIAGVFSYLFSTIWQKEGQKKSRTKKGFQIISYVGSIIVLFMIIQNPYQFFNHQTGKSQFWVSDTERKIYYSPGFGIEDGKPLRPGTAKDAKKYKLEYKPPTERIKSFLQEQTQASEPKQLSSLAKPRTQRHLSGIFRIPPKATVVSDIYGNKIGFLRNERVILIVTNGSYNDLVWVNKNIPSIQITQKRTFIRGISPGMNHVKLMNNGDKDIFVDIRVKPKRV